MKKFFSILAIVIALAAVSSCGIGTELTFNQNQIQTSVVLSQNNFNVIRTVSGEASAEYIFGIGGRAQVMARNAATANMIKNAGLVGSQAIANTNIVYYEETVLGIWTRVTAYATGTVVEFK
ncbi:MAG: hypothetical protein J5699_01740 [Bacteroidales bacterium]|nr:hypothetical protein [Bacteroidales bacterium]